MEAITPAPLAPPSRTPVREQGHEIDPQCTATPGNRTPSAHSIPRAASTTPPRGPDGPSFGEPSPLLAVAASRPSQPEARRICSQRALVTVFLMAISACSQSSGASQAEQALSSPECQAYASERDACLGRLTGTDQTSASATTTSPYGLVLQLGNHPSRELLDEKCKQARKQLHRTCQ
jgi:hypothetical protein